VRGAVDTMGTEKCQRYGVEGHEQGGAAIHLDSDRAEWLPPWIPKVVFLQQRMFPRFYD